MNDSTPLQTRWDRLRSGIGRAPSMLVAYSGGVDSALLAKVAHDVLGAKMLAVTARSESLAARELDEARAFVERHGIPWRLIETRELDNPQYAANPADRCYFCKDELFTRLDALAASEGWAAVAYGANTDDFGDFRPGQTAAREHQVLAPLVEAGLGKEDVRALARQLELEVWDKPAAPCLSSRIPHGDPVTVATLARIEAAEEAVRRTGIRTLRVRHHGDTARIEVLPEDLARLVAPGVRETLVSELQKIGYKFVTLDLGGFKSGNLNPTPPS